jgi:hypothetical protein
MYKSNNLIKLTVLYKYIISYKGFKSCYIIGPKYTNNAVILHTLTWTSIQNGAVIDI